MSDTLRVRYDELVRAIEEALAKEGVPEAVRRVEAELTAEADLLGVPSHGVRMLPGVIRGLRTGRLNPDPKMRVIREGPATSLLDADRGPGRYASAYAMDLAIERARKYGAGVVVATSVAHWGRAHAYAYRAARAGMIGLCTTNAIPNMLGWGAKQPVLGNNPLAIAAPRGAGQDPIVLDIAMSQAAVGKLGTYVREGRAAPDGWGLDADGNPTSDPSAILASRNILPMGAPGAGHKGAGLALMMELLTGALAGGLLSHEIGETDASGLDADGSKFMLAIDVSAFVGPEVFAERVAAQLAFVAAGAGDGFLSPGERGWRARDEHLRDGIPIHGQIVSQLAEVGVVLGGVA